MRFWQLVSAFRSNLSMLEKLLERPEWKQYQEWLREFNQHVTLQNRSVLDATLPKDLVVRAMALSDHRFCVDGGVLRQSHASTEKSISATEAYNLYGADAIDEVLEKGSYQCADCKAENLGD